MRCWPAYVRNTVYRTLVETAAGEHGGAADGDEERDRQRDRYAEPVQAKTTTGRAQAQITQEIAEIVGGAAALD